ncbi:MAG TPA: 50S ribosomal protein L25, partial [Macellibacteroides fermentans]|nr:50S ribosomal protein L25 [Macellibacteroides fermentans]
MKTFQLEGTPRTEIGKKAAKAIRKEEMIPAVLYGGESTIHFNVTKDAVRKLIYTPEIFIVDLTIGDKKTKAIIKDLQFHPV